MSCGNGCYLLTNVERQTPLCIQSSLCSCMLQYFARRDLPVDLFVHITNPFD